MRDKIISSDLQKISIETLEFMQYDNGSTITVQLFDNGQTVDLTGATVTAKFERADGNKYNRSTVISGNTATVTLDSTVTAVDGILKIVLKIVKDDKQVHTFMIESEIIKGIGEGNTGDIGGNTGNNTEITVDLSNFYTKQEIDSQFQNIAN